MLNPIKLPPPTICDMNCYYKPGHPGRHQFETPEAYEMRVMKPEETLILVRSGGTRPWSEWNGPFTDVVETQEENFSDRKVNADPTEVIEVKVIRRATVQAKVKVTYD